MRRSLCWWTSKESDIDFQRERKRERGRVEEERWDDTVCIVAWNEPNRPVQPRAAVPYRGGGWFHGQGRWNQPSVLSSCDPRTHPARARPVKLHGIMINDADPPRACWSITSVIPWLESGAKFVNRLTRSINIRDYVGRRRNIYLNIYLGH